MDISTYEAWLEEERRDRERLAVTHPEYVQSHLHAQQELDEGRRLILGAFPHSVVTEGDYPEHSYAGRWCWQHIGPENGPCDNWHSDYPACPLVLATEHVPPGEFKNADGQVIPCTRKAYRNPGEHEHQGEWCSLWFGKTGYDYGFCEYYFANETDYTQFLAACPTFTWDEAWE